jgi:hypothetical protein
MVSWSTSRRYATCRTIDTGATTYRRLAATKTYELSCESWSVNRLTTAATAATTNRTFATRSRPRRA